jgi:hypothetical protein
MQVDPPRPLSETERAVLGALLAPWFPGVEELRAQLPHATVISTCDCGCPTVDMSVPSQVPASPVTTRGRLAPVEGTVRPVASEPVGNIILFVAEARLRSLELVSYDERAPAEWPPLERITVERTDGP